MEKEIRMRRRPASALPQGEDRHGLEVTIIGVEPQENVEEPAPDTTARTLQLTSQKYHHIHHHYNPSSSSVYSRTTQQSRGIQLLKTFPALDQTPQNAKHRYAKEVTDDDSDVKNRLKPLINVTSPLQTGSRTVLKISCPRTCLSNQIISKNPFCRCDLLIRYLGILSILRYSSTRVVPNKFFSQFIHKIFHAFCRIGRVLTPRGNMSRVLQERAASTPQHTPVLEAH